MAAGAYGDRISRIAQVRNPPSIKTLYLQKALVALTRVRCDRRGTGVTAPIPRENAYIVGLELSDQPERELWVEGRGALLGPQKQGTFTLHNLLYDPRCDLPDPFDSLHFYVPHAALDAVAEEQGVRNVECLHVPSGVAIDDPVIRHLGLCLLPALQNPEEASRLFVDLVTGAALAHLAHHYGKLPLPRRLPRGGLASWQERRAQELMLERIDGDVSLEELAHECRLSRSHFARAFRQTTGQSPHRWLMSQRIALSQDLLRNSELSIGGIADRCGYANQSHFTRVFARYVGVNPGEWRRLQR
jgi:AraC family transcriptional regulator